MNALNGELSVQLNMEEDTENLPHNLARYARASYSKKVCEILMKYFGITLSSNKISLGFIASIIGYRQL